MRRFFTVIAITSMMPVAGAQVIRGGGNPYSSQLLTDPDAGTIQGIQRYGKPLATDPEQGTAYPYFVRPSVSSPFRSSPFSSGPTVRLTPFQQSLVQQHFADLDSQAENVKLSPNLFGLSGLGGASAASMSTLLSQTGSGESVARDVGRSFVTLAAPPAGSVHTPRTFGANGTYDDPNAFISHQPLVQIKLRVVEINRNDNLSVTSTLDYIRSRSGKVSEFNNPNVSTPSVHGQNKNLTSLSRFNPASMGLATVANDAMSFGGLSGAGALVNLTSRHMNWIASMLADELEADVLTAPELVTTNGESVEFVAGSKSPFVIGTVRTGDSGEDPVKNHVFYKHIGTYLRVTPRIVNFRAYGTGYGNAAITASDIAENGWPQVISFLLDEGFLAVAAVDVEQKRDENGEPLENGDGNPDMETLQEARVRIAGELQPYTKPNRLVPLETKTFVLDLLNQFARRDIQVYIQKHNLENPGILFGFTEVFCCGDCDADGCDWSPDDCTIDLEVVARFSNRQNGDLPDDLTGPNPEELSGDAESDVRAISNIIQLKNNTGLVMAGLMGESDVVSVAKVPVLGDLPGVGALFRGKSVGRKKTEILIFIEAQVLDQNPMIARSQSASDLHLAAPYVSGGTLENPLELGLHRAGFGTYLPPPTKDEQQYWEECYRRVNRINTTVYDALR